MRVFVTSVLVILSLAFAGVASAGIPSASTSTVERQGQGSPGTCDPDVAIVCPASDLGSVLVTVTVRNVYGDPLADKAVTCYAIPDTGAVFCFCPGEDPQADTTDVNGEVFFSFTDFGGCGNIQFGAESEGVVFNPSPSIFVASPDINGDCIANLTDFITFAGGYLSTDPCLDYDCSGTADLSDFITFASHYLDACP